MTWKNLKNPLKALVMLGVVAGSAFSALPVQQKIHLGLDLVGGSRLLLQLYPTAEVPQITPQIQQQTIQVVDRRINALGVAEPTISKFGPDRILVELPGLNQNQTAEAENLLKTAAVLEFKIVPPNVAAQAQQYLDMLKTPGLPAAQRAAAQKYVNETAYALSGPVVYSGKDLKGAQAGYQQQGGSAIVLFQTKDAARFGRLTTANMGRPLGIFLDHVFVSAPNINGAIFGSGEIEGNFTSEDTITLANELNAGALPATIRIIENESVGATLGKADLVKSLWAASFGLGLVLIFMILAYRLPGFLADVALAAYVLVMIAIFAISKATLTLPSIAGFVLSVGMAVDANVLIFERIKEELWNGKSLRAAVRVGFQRAFTAVFDSHFTTIVGAGVLYMLGTGTVKGFAFALFWGTVISLITAVFVTRFFVDLLVDNDLATAPALWGVKREEVGIFSKGTVGAP
ncbi:MAG TPA: protein translocase subunit SecD [Candidatus Tyrphobacter sp.]